jgi:hypothetical protein
VETIFKNWKTSLAGVAIVAMAIGLVTGHVTTQQFLTVFGALTGGGLLAAKDSDK